MLKFSTDSYGIYTDIGVGRALPEVQKLCLRNCAIGDNFRQNFRANLGEHLDGADIVSSISRAFKSTNGPNRNIEPSTVDLVIYLSKTQGGTETFDKLWPIHKPDKAEVEWKWDKGEVWDNSAMFGDGEDEVRIIIPFNFIGAALKIIGLEEAEISQISDKALSILNR